MDGITEIKNTNSITEQVPYKLAINNETLSGSIDSNLNNGGDSNNNIKISLTSSENLNIPKKSHSTFIRSKKSTLSTSPTGSSVSIGKSRTLDKKTIKELLAVETNNNNITFTKNTTTTTNTTTTYKQEQKEEESTNQHMIEVKWRDKHGFVIEEFIPELKKFELVEYSEDNIQLKLNNWTTFNEHYRHVGLCSNQKELDRILGKGLPHMVRDSLWTIYSGSNEKKRKEEMELFKQQKEEMVKSRAKGLGTIRGLTPPVNRKSYYNHLHSIMKSSNRLSTKMSSISEIEKDITRTFPGHTFFDSDEGKKKLSRVLQAYSIRNRKVGYCQSMNVVAGILLYVLNNDEEDAFWMLATIVEDYCQNYYSTNLMGSQVDMLVFEKLVSTHKPTLYAHLQSFNISLPLLSTKWFMCLFIGVLPTEIALRVWDHLFLQCGIYGYNKPIQESQWLENKSKEYKCLGIASYNLLLTGLAILSYLEESLLNCNSTTHILAILSSHTNGVFNSKDFFKKFRHFRKKIDEDSFIELKKVQEVKFIHDLEDMRKLRDLNQTSKITRFSKTDLEKIWNGFRSMDASRYSMGRSLKLDYLMFYNVFQYIIPNVESKEVLIKQLFKSFDKNRDGILDFSELMSGLCILAKGTSEERLQLYFSFFDSDDNGFVTKEELQLMLQNVYDKIDMDPLAVTQYSIEEYVDMVFSNLGITDNRLSFELFRQALSSYPTIFRCFMLEEETFRIEDFENTLNQSVGTSDIIDFSQTTSYSFLNNNNNNHHHPTGLLAQIKMIKNQQENSSLGVNNSNTLPSSSQPSINKKKSASRLKFQEALSRENEKIEKETEKKYNTINTTSTPTISTMPTTKTSQTTTNTNTNDSNQVSQVSISIENEQVPIIKEKKSTVTPSVFINAIEIANLNNNIDNYYQANNNNNNNNNNNKQAGNPLSPCCKFM